MALYFSAISQKKGVPKDAFAVFMNHSLGNERRMYPVNFRHFVQCRNHWSETHRHSEPCSNDLEV